MKEFKKENYTYTAYIKIMQHFGPSIQKIENRLNRLPKQN